MEWVLFILIFLMIILICFLIVRNTIIKLENKVQEAFATMDVYLKKRWDLIPNLVESVKEYTNYEKNTLEEILKLRSVSYDKLSDDEKYNKSKTMTNEINKLVALKESYPELKANQNFLALSTDLRNIEDDIANSRKYYNAVVLLYNNKIETFPANIVAKILKYRPQNMFSALDQERENVEVNL